MTERLSDKNPCNACKVDRQIGNPNRWQCECDRCDKPYDWKSECVKKLAEYETSEKEGRLVVLPCKVGEEIYAIYTGSTGKNPTIMRTSFDYGLIPYFGKSVFLSYEEAEKALEEMEKDE